MTNEEAIEILSRPFNMKNVPQDILEAHRMAVKALEQKPRKDEVILTKEEYGELVSSEFDNGYAKGYREAIEQESCDDWYDVPSDELTLEQARQAVKDLRKKLAEYLEQEPCDMKQRVEKEYLYESLCEDLKKANAEIKRLSEPFEDAISRQAVDELSKELVHTTRDKADFLCNFWEGLQKLPPVTPKEKTQWIPVSERLPEKYGEYLITWTTSQSKRPFIGISEGEITGEYDHKHNRFKVEWLLEDYIKAYPNVEVIAWMPLPEPYKAESEE